MAPDARNVPLPGARSLRDDCGPEIRGSRRMASLMRAAGVIRSSGFAPGRQKSSPANGSARARRRSGRIRPTNSGRKDGRSDAVTYACGHNRGVAQGLDMAPLLFAAPAQAPGDMRSPFCAASGAGAAGSDRPNPESRASASVSSGRRRSRAKSRYRPARSQRSGSRDRWRP
jgi:hypothetical protein